MKFSLKSIDHKLSTLVIFILLIATSLPGCTPAPSNAKATPVQSKVASSTYAGKKIVYVSSYHVGYPWADGITAGVRTVLDDTGVELKIINLDTKQHPEEEFGIAAGKKAKAEIDAFKPDLVIASDDNAQKYLVEPYLKGTKTPVVFNGINWDAALYGYSPSQITGMIEVELPDQLFDLLKGYAKGSRLGYITVDTETERKVVDIYNQRFFSNQMKVYWVKSQAEFKNAFLAAQKETDIMFFGNNAGISDPWDDAAMRQFIQENTMIPTGSLYDFLAPYVLLTLAKSAEEQGEWSAKTALRILSGTPVSEISTSENKKGQLIANLILADKMKIVFAPSLLKTAVILDK